MAAAAHGHPHHVLRGDIAALSPCNDDTALCEGLRRLCAHPYGAGVSGTLHEGGRHCGLLDQLPCEVVW
jgi:hypothetical protein